MPASASGFRAVRGGGGALLARLARPVATVKLPHLVESVHMSRDTINAINVTVGKLIR